MCSVRMGDVVFVLHRRTSQSRVRSWFFKPSFKYTSTPNPNKLIYWRSLKNADLETFQNYVFMFHYVIKPIVDHNILTKLIISDFITGSKTRGNQVAHIHQQINKLFIPIFIRNFFHIFHIFHSSKLSFMLRFYHAYIAQT